MDSKGNHKKYREALNTSPTPAVPYFGLYLKDLQFISDGNADYLKGGVINLNKRRKVRGRVPFFIVQPLAMCPE